MAGEVDGIARVDLTVAVPAAQVLDTIDTRAVSPMLATPRPIDWSEFRRIAGDDVAARTRFERLVAALVAISRPGAHRPRGDGHPDNPGGALK